MNRPKLYLHLSCLTSLPTYLSFHLNLTRTLWGTYTSPSTTVSPGPPSPSSTVTYVHDATLPMPTQPPVTGYLHTKFVVDSREANSGPDRAGARHQEKMKGSLRTSKPISTHHADYFSKLQSRSRTGRSAVCSFHDRNARTCCSWQNEDGGLCGAPVTYNNCAEHFPTDHAIKDLGANVEALCRRCPLDTEKKVSRKNILRHMREAHLHRPRSKNGIHEYRTDADAAPSL
ncbi:hypothetical protein F5141DRAFT_81662 [Pisolithus sp. B1]|nr:hypothetical protein F5141DRAFT_81662 [Pisolithus sp. B1]